MPHDEQRSKIQKLGGGEAGDEPMAGFGAMGVGHLAVMLREVVRGELQGLAKSAELAVIAASVSELRTSCDADRVVASSRLDAQDRIGKSEGAHGCLASKLGGPARRAPWPRIRWWQQFVWGFQRLAQQWWWWWRRAKSWWSCAEQGLSKFGRRSRRV